MTTESSKRTPFPAEPLTLRLDRELSKFSWLEKSLIMAELSRLAYGPPDLISNVVYQAGIDQCDFVQQAGSEAYVFSTPYDCMIVARGTEPTKWEDIAADAKAWTVACDIGESTAGSTDMSMHCGQTWKINFVKTNDRFGSLATPSEAQWPPSAPFAANYPLYRQTPKLSSHSVPHVSAIKPTRHFSKLGITVGSITTISSRDSHLA